MSVRYLFKIIKIHNNYFAMHNMLYYFSLKTMDFDESIGLVDALLGTYDQNDNGLLEYVEFITAFKESRHQLGI